MSNSPLIAGRILSPNCSPRNHIIDTVSVHVMAGVLSAENCGRFFASPNARASSNYGIGNDGTIILYVPEDKRSWCTSSAANDNRAVTIEVSNSVAAHPWPVSPAAYRSLILLLADITQRNNMGGLRWQGNKNLIGQVDKQNMTVHRWFAAKACCGDYLYNLHGQIANEVNQKLQMEEDDMDVNRFKELWYEMRTELQDNDASSWSEDARNWAVKTGLVKGTSDGEFNGAWEDVLSREQMVTILYRFSKMK